MKKNKFLIILMTSVLFWGGCNTSDSPDDTPTTGSLSISADETFKPLIDSEIDTFNSIYNYADVKVNYKSSAEAFNSLMNDSIRLIIVSRNLNKEELKQFEKWEIVPKITKIAYDAVAVIGSNDLKDTMLTIQELAALLSGKDPGNNTKIVFDNNNSGTVEYLKNKTGVTALSTKCYALNSNESVIDYVSKEPGCIGIIGVNWISDKDDPGSLEFLNSVKTISIAESDTSEYYKPYQAYIALTKYPLCRTLYIISKEAYTGLGTGLTAFIASERGQRVVLKFGLVPATMPVRLVELINDENIY